MAWFAAALLAQTGYWFLRWSLNIEHWIYLALVNFWTAPKFEPIVDVDLSFCGCLQAFLLCVHALEFKLLVVWFLHCGYQGRQSVDVELWLKMRHPPSNYSIHTCISQPSSSAASSRPVRPQASSASHASPWPSSFGSRSCSFSIASFCFSYSFSSCFIRTNPSYSIIFHALAQSLPHAAKLKSQHLSDMLQVQQHWLSSTVLDADDVSRVRLAENRWQKDSRDPSVCGITLQDSDP